jgi:L-lysine 6-transaminase
MESVATGVLSPESVKEILSKHMLTRGMMPLVLDMERSRGVDLYDMRDGRRYLDFFGFYASSAVGMNHEKMTGNEGFRHRLMETALNKITNSDILTPHMARFVNTFSRVGIPEYLPYAFFVAGGALAVENALKAAFDWKVRLNFRKGYRREVGTKVIHFDQAFHGRSGYTLSLTNTADPKKTMYFPKFDWPRVVNPYIRYPQSDESRGITEIEERNSLNQIEQAFREHGDDIACIIIEPIQGEGGDNHFRPEFLQAVKDLAHQNDALLIFDEVQSGVGITGEFWAHQSIGVEPDIIAFGKKTQVCGILASRKLDEVDGHVFQTPSRINSTWGGNLVDMVRFDRILEIIEEDDLVAHASRVGDHLLDRLREMESDLEWISGTRGRGLMCAFDLPHAAFRDAVLNQCHANGVIILGCGTRSIRFRSPLTINEEQIDMGLEVLAAAVKHVGEGN